MREWLADSIQDAVDRSGCESRPAFRLERIQELALGLLGACEEQVVEVLGQALLNRISQTSHLARPRSLLG